MKIETVRQLIYWSYANLAMAHSALDKKQIYYSRINYMIRSRLYNGLIAGKMNIRSILDDEKIKINIGKQCFYCGSIDDISIEHIFPKANGGRDDAENLICACRSCNSSKGKKDMLEWFSIKNNFPSIYLLRRYLKLVYFYCEENDILDSKIIDIDDSEFPFKLKNIPIDFPKLEQIKLLP